MAKCIKKGNKIVRVPNDQAKDMVENKGYKYVSKNDWKRYEDEKENKNGTDN